MSEVKRGQWGERGGRWHESRERRVVWRLRWRGGKREREERVERRDESDATGKTRVTSGTGGAAEGDTVGKGEGEVRGTIRQSEGRRRTGMVGKEGEGRRRKGEVGSGAKGEGKARKEVGKRWGTSY